MAAPRCPEVTAESPHDHPQETTTWRRGDSKIVAQYWNLGVRCAVVLVFLVSTASKVSGPSAFAEFITSARTIGGLSARQARPVAVAVVGVETAVVILTTLPATAVAGLCLAGWALIGFAVAVGRAIRHGRAVACRCFGSSSTPLGVTQIIRNVALAGLTVSGLLAGPPAAPTPAGMVLALAGGALVATVVVRFDDIVDLLMIR